MPRATAPNASQAISVKAISVKTRTIAIGDTVMGVHLIGEIVNESEIAVTDIEIVGSILDADGKVLAAGSSIYNLALLEPGQKSPYLIFFDRMPESATESRVQVRAAAAEGSFSASYYTHDVELVDVQLQPPGDSFLASWTLTGEVRNTGQEAINKPKIIGAVFDAAGTIIAVEQGYGELDQLAPGESSPFQIDVNGVESIDSYYLVVESTRAN